MPIVKVNDILCHVLDQGHGTSLLLVHGFPLDHTMWQGQINDLAKDYRVIAPDLRGFGRSLATSGEIAMEQFADDLAVLLDVLGVVEQVVFCGLSMGGYIAWQFWRRHPARLAALILCDTRALADPPDVAQGRLATAERVLAEGVSLLPETMLPRLFAPVTFAQQPELIAATRRVMLATPSAGAAAALRGMARRHDFTSQLGEIKVPTLVVCGEQDAIATVSEMRSMAACIAGAQFIEIPDAGHLAPLEKPASVNAAIRDFLAARAAGSPG
ncbi:MAG: alpha/beta fold hydrolase [Planctomycetota bacterium]|nr:alpha/beta fold hydrolase [Planctomycetota bacterium]